MKDYKIKVRQTARGEKIKRKMTGGDDGNMWEEEGNGQMLEASPSHDYSATRVCALLHALPLPRSQGAGYKINSRNVPIMSKWMTKQKGKTNKRSTLTHV